MASLGKAIIDKPLLFLPLPPKLAPYLEFQSNRDSFLFLKYKLQSYRPEKLRNFCILCLFNYLKVNVLSFINFWMCGLGVYIFFLVCFKMIKKRSYSFETSHLHFEFTQFFS